MEIRFDTLEGTAYPTIFETFLEAFADYAVDMSYLTAERFRNRMIKNGVELAASPGAFSGDQLVGFTMVGLGRHGGAPAAFDAATGIVPGHRGRGLAGRLFDEARPNLEARGIRRFYLEVLTGNEPAIQAYRKSGFSVSRELKSFLWSATAPDAFSPPPPGVVIRPLPREALSVAEDWMVWEPSWENSFASISRVPDGLVCLGALAGEEVVGCIAYYSGLNWVSLLAVSPAHRRQGVGQALLAGLSQELGPEAGPVKLINVEGGDRAALAFLEACGADPLLSQFEMVLEF